MNDDAKITAIALTQDERTLLRRALALAASVYTSDAIQLFRVERNAEATAAYETAVAVRKIESKLEMQEISDNG